MNPPTKPLLDQEGKELLIEAHRARWASFWTWLGFALALVLAQALLVLTGSRELYLLAIPVTLLVAHLMHSQLLAFHEAAHGVLCPARWLNEAVGIAIGTLHLIGLSLFRAIHHTHHAHLATPKDEQLWPFVNPRTPRWVRLLAAFCELTFGMFFDAVQFWRAFLRKGSPVRQRSVRRRIWMETVLTVSLWTSLIGYAAIWGTGKWLTVLYIIPALLAGSMHSWRKYIEHMGLTGSSVTGLTRTVVPTSALGRWFAFTMFNINYHGVHHYYASLPQASLPKFTALLTPQTSEEQPVYFSYRSALWTMLPTLRDPKVGPQWNRPPSDTATETSQMASAAVADGW